MAGSQNWIKNIVKSSLISAAENLGATHDPTVTTEITGTTTGTKRGLDVEILGGATIAASAESKIIVVTPTITTASPYAVGDCIGGIQTISAAVLANDGTGVLESLSVTEGSKLLSEMDIHFWNASPAGTFTDSSICAPTNDDLKNLWLGGVRLWISDYFTFSANAAATVKNIGLVVATSGGVDDFYATAITRSVKTYTSATALTFKYGFLQD